MPRTREQLEHAPIAYFEAVDRKDMDAALGFFAEDATFTVQSAHITFAGRDEGIRQMFETFFTDYATIVHGVTNVINDLDVQILSAFWRQEAAVRRTCCRP